VTSHQSRTKRLVRCVLKACGLVAALVVGLIAATVAVNTRYFTDQSEAIMTPFHPFRSREARDGYLTQYDLRARKWPVPSETRMVSTAFGQTFVRISGRESAPPLVLLHGGSNNSLMWIPNIKTLSEHFRTYAIDAIDDNGRSIQTRPLKSPEDLINWLGEVLDALGLESGINLLGVSYGGWLASQCALRIPKRLSKIVMVAPPLTVLPLSGGFAMRAILCLWPPRQYFTKRFLYWLFEDLARSGAAGRAALNDEAEFQSAAMQAFTPRRLVKPTLLTDSELKGITVPALYLVGEHEKLYSSPAKEAVARLARVAPQIRAEIMPGAGHDVTIVRADLVNKKILEFLSQP